MNIYINENNTFLNSISSLCNKTNKDRLELKPKYGKGFLNYRLLTEGLELYQFEFNFSSPIMAIWDFSQDVDKTYYLFDNRTTSDNLKLPSPLTIDDTIEEGLMLFTESGDRRRLWMPGIDYRLLGLHFTEDWLAKANTLVDFSDHIYTHLESLKHLQSNLAYSVETKHIINQIAGATPLHNKKSLNAYQINKCIELIIISFDNIFSDISAQKTKDAVHPRDFDLINRFVGDFEISGNDIPQLESMASQMGMSKSKFQRTFKKVIGSSFYQFILKKRMLRAVELLLDHHSVVDVALEVGYSSTGNFTQAFKNYYKVLPSEIRNY